MSEAAFAMAELDRRSNLLIQVGTVAEVDHDAGRARVRIGDWVSAMLPWQSLSSGEVRRWRSPSVGEQVLLLCPCGLPENGWILPGFSTAQFTQPDTRPHTTAEHMPDGARVEYDWQAHQYLLDVPAGGRILLRIGGTQLELKADGSKLTTPKLVVDSPQSTFTGNVTVQKTLLYQGGMAGYGSAAGSGGAAATIHGPVDVRGNVKVVGSIDATGSVMDGGGNSNHHSHP